ncbi:LysR substrate binding domain-containing protein [Streptomyces sp. Ncost-T6T-2b]|nr:LysR substrate binding domain-containing protein [Streptomyces sp. Ncost-T6T-2b]
MRISCTATDYGFAQSLVRAGVGIALIPEIGLTRHPDLIAFPLAEPSPRRHLGLALSRRRRGPAARLAEELASRILGEAEQPATDFPASVRGRPRPTSKATEGDQA